MYAWIKQIATSNKIYPKLIASKMIVDGSDVNHAAAQYTPTNLRTMWPALILAASRNDKVIGRTIILVVSISTRNGFNQLGAPSGRKWAIDALGAFVNVDIIILSQIGNPKLMVKIRCLDNLNVYGTNPIRLMIMIIEKRGVIIDLNPLRFAIYVRSNWWMMMEWIGEISAFFREGLIQKKDCIIIMIEMLMYRNAFRDGT